MPMRNNSMSVRRARGGLSTRHAMHGAVALVAAWVFCGIGCSVSRPPSPPDTFAVAADLSTMMTLDPAAISESLTSGIMRNVCDPLLAMDEQDASKVEPGLAESWTVSDDQQTYTFHLRRGLRFASGNPVTAHDVAWSIRRSIKLNLATAKRLREWGFTADNVDQSVLAENDHTLVVHLARPYAPSLFLYAFTDYRIASALDRETIVEHEVDGDLGNRWLSKTAACYGPFQVKTWRPQEVIILERNDDWWRYQSSIRKVIMRHIPEAGAQRLMLEKGDVDYALNVDPADYQALEENPDTYLHKARTMRVAYMAFNSQDPLFDDPKVVRALRYLIDYQGLEATVLKNAAVVCQYPVPPGMFGSIEPEHRPFRLAPAEAKRLLAEAGYPDGFEFELLVHGSFPYPDIAQHLQQNAAAAGVTVNLQSIIGKHLFSKLRNRNFQASISGYSFNYPDANNVMLRHGYNPADDGTKRTGSVAWRTSWYPGQWFNDTVLAAQVEKDPARRQDMYEELQRYHMENAPIVYLFQRIGVRALHENVQEVKANALGLSFSSAVKRGAR